MSSKTLLVTCVAAAAALFASGCGKKEASAPTPGATNASSAPAAQTAPTTPAAPAGPKVLELTANDAMKFGVPGKTIPPTEQVRLEAKAGEPVRIVLQNIGALPKEAMGHNVVVLKKGVNVDEFAAAAIAAGAPKGYFPSDRADQTLAHTPLIGPKAKAEASFNAPTEPGEYVFICTFPGHVAAGMRGVLVVQ
jgi:azurin